MKRPALFAGAAIAAAGAWVVAASALYCSGIGRLDLFTFPYAQWFQATSYWGVNWWVKLWLVLSAAGPLLLIGGISFPLIRWQTPKASVYGRTQWADRKQMADGGIKGRAKLP